MGIYQKMGRRWISLLLVFLMVFSLVPVDELMQVFAAEKPAITVGVSYRITCNNGNQRTLINP